MPTLKRRIKRHIGQLLLDLAAWAAAVALAVAFRYDLHLTPAIWQGIVGFTILAMVTQAVVGYHLYLYRGRYQHGTFHEARTLITVVLVVGAFLAVMSAIFSNQLGVPRSTPLFAIPVAFVLMGSFRYLKRLRAEQRRRPDMSAERTLIYGAGTLAEYVITGMLKDPRSKYRPVGLIDDDPAKSSLDLHGVRVLGNGSSLDAIAKKSGAAVLVIAMAQADSSLIKKITDESEAAGLRVRIVPSLSELLEQPTDGSIPVRDIAIEDLIGRNPVDTQVDSVAGYLRGKRVLVTGAGGSIGSELCRQITRYAPSELIMLDRDESGLHGTQMSIAGHGLLDTRDVVLADIRDPDALDAIFVSRQPQVVFHAAALKHLPMLEQYPDEAWKTNVIGTLNVLRASLKVGVTTFINISTDKAANPTSILGHSKRVAEKITSWAAQQSRMDYLSVRFGNVIGSRGSMLPTFAAQIEAGGPITVTHPDVTRYFMTIPEASQLVVQAGGIGRPGEVLILDMGEPVSILEIAKRMISMSGRDVAIKFTGLREGEKMHEELFGLSETDDRPFHPKISHTTADILDPQNLNRRRWQERCGLFDTVSTAHEELVR